MPSNAIITSSDSQDPVDTVVYGPDDRPALVLTALAYEALEEDDEFAFACPGCLRPLLYCSCAMSGD